MKKYSLFILVLLSLSLSSSLLGSDSVSKQLKRADSIRSSDTKEFWIIINELKNKELGSKYNKDFLLYLEGYGLGFSGHFDKAIKILEGLNDESVDKTLRYRAGISIVNSLIVPKKYTEALEALENTLVLSEEIDDTDIRNGGYIMAAITYNQVGQYELGLYFSDKLLSEGVVGREKCFSGQLKLEALHKLKKSLDDTPLADEIIKHCIDLNEFVVVGFIRTYLAKQLLENGQYDQSKLLLEQTLELAKNSRYPRLISEYYSLLAVTYWNLNELDLARQFASQALALDQTSRYADPAIQANRVLYQVNKSEGNYSEALEFHEEFLSAHKASMDDLATKQLAFQVVKQQTLEKNKQIQLLNKQNEVLKLEQDLAKKEAANNRLIVLLLVFILASGAFWSYRVKRNQVKLKHQSETDLLTGVCSRHHFYSLSRQNLEYASNNNQEVSFILFDMDNFKSVNDSYGHLVGDWVLKKAIEASRPCWRQNDIAGRLGGEEFAIMLPACSLNKATEIAENCRKAIQSIDTTESGHKFSISASFGITNSKVSGYQLRDLIADADRIMYQAKAAGKNQTLKVTQKG